MSPEGGLLYLGNATSSYEGAMEEIQQWVDAVDACSDNLFFLVPFESEPDEVTARATAGEYLRRLRLARLSSARKAA